MGKAQGMLEEEKKHSKLQVFFFVIFIPLVFTIMMVYVLLTLYGVDVNGKVKEAVKDLPIISKEEQKEQEVEELNLQKSQDIKQLETSLQEKKKKIHDMQDKLNEKDLEIENLQIQVQRLNEQLAEADKKREAEQTGLKEMVSVYEKMAPKKAALIISELEEDKAMMLLSQFKPDKLSAILEKMDPPIAAKYTGLLSKEVSEND
ncbi:flagellar motility protein MotE (MotC chaperone) [Bacillus fengqiuensis]|nr:flagellar motility protein MotE (MotC chaperone) [Bacillus fengqiuensis]